AHLEAVGKYAGPKAIVEFLSKPETCAQLGIKKTVSLHTAQQWMQHCGGFCWHKTPKGQCFDGHEQADIVKSSYHYGRSKKPVIIWFHDELIFFANNCRLIHWVPENKHAKPFKKGERATIMVADFVCAEFGWLQGKNG
ncbi:hypothetical protein B0J17DRAFT_584116, partial [Rhizoctonia solani]